MIYLPRLVKSFKYAFRGLAIIFREEQNFRIHVFCACIVFIFALMFRIRLLEALILLLSVTLLLVLEIINTAFEKFQDLLKPRVHHYVGYMKDILAGAVLLSALSATLTALIIFFPYFLSFIRYYN